MKSQRPATTLMLHAALEKIAIYFAKLYARYDPKFLDPKDGRIIEITIIKHVEKPDQKVAKIKGEIVSARSDEVLLENFTNLFND